MKLSIFAAIVLIGAVLTTGNANADIEPEERALRDPGEILKNAMDAGISGGKAALGAAAAIGQGALGLGGRADMETEERAADPGLLDTIKNGFSTGIKAVKNGLAGLGGRAAMEPEERNG